MSDAALIVHVRFAPSGAVTEIGERPEPLSGQEWFDRLTADAGMCFRALSGGRGMFRLTRAQLDKITAKTPQ